MGFSLKRWVLYLLASFWILVFVFIGIIFSCNGNVSKVLGASKSAGMPMIIIDGDKEISGLSQSQDLLEIFDDLDVIVYEEDLIRTFPDPKWGRGSKIYLTRAPKFLVLDANRPKELRSWKANVGELFEEKGIKLFGQDSVNPPFDTELKPGIIIKITRVAEVEVREIEKIDFKTIQKTTVDLEKGTDKIDRVGIKGERENTFIIKRINGVDASKTLKSTQVIKKPVDEILLIGIGPKLVKSGPFKDIINGAAKKYLINGTAISCLMIRESGGNPTRGFPTAKFQGLFQYTSSSWVLLSRKAGYGGASITDATAQIYTTAWALTHGYQSYWPPWGGCKDK